VCRRLVDLQQLSRRHRRSRTASRFESAESGHSTRDSNSAAGCVATVVVRKPASVWTAGSSGSIADRPVRNAVCANASFQWPNDIYNGNINADDICVGNAAQFRASGPASFSASGET